MSSLFSSTSLTSPFVFKLALTAGVFLALNQLHVQQKKKQSDIDLKKKYLLGKLNLDNSWNQERKQVIISLTTSPLRIDKIKQVLDNIHPSTYDLICVNLPDFYGRTREEYIVPEWMKTYPKLLINRFGKDLGPISKVVPTMEKFPDSFIVSIDDDILYKPYFINLLGHIYLHAQKKNAIVTQHGTNLSSYWFDLKKKNKKLVEEGLRLFQSLERNNISKKKIIQTKKFNYRFVELIEGFASIMYSPTSYNTEIVQELKTLSALSKACFQSDDMVLSACFSMHAVPKISVCFVKGVSLFQVVRELNHGLGHDALHNIQNHGENYVNALRDITLHYSS
jgi:hypothetical protein